MLLKSLLCDLNDEELFVRAVEDGIKLWTSETLDETDPREQESLTRPFGAGIDSAVRSGTPQEVKALFNGVLSLIVVEDRG